ncbi:MAG: alpha/beta fold hydrolase [Pseudomonadota bacterium]
MTRQPPPLVLLPGMMCDARLFAPQIAYFSGHRAVMVAPLVGHSTIEALAHSVLDAAPETFALAGLSMGGIVAMHILDVAPERVSAVALVDTNPSADTPEKVRMRDAQIERVSRGQLRSVMRDEMKPNYLADGPNTGRILDVCMAMAETLGPTVFESQSRALQCRRDYRSTLRNAETPALLLCGEHDTLCPPGMHEDMHALIRSSTLHIVADAGHLPTLEQPDATNRLLARWLADT